jgi:hypothetical protein
VNDQICSKWIQKLGFERRDTTSMDIIHHWNRLQGYGRQYSIDIGLDDKTT